MRFHGARTRYDARPLIFIPEAFDFDFALVMVYYLPRQDAEPLVSIALLIDQGTLRSRPIYLLFQLASITLLLQFSKRYSDEAYESQPP